MSKLSRRDWLILIGVWIVAGVLMALVVILYFRNSPVAHVPPTPAPTPTPIPTFTVEYREVTANSLYPLAEAPALKWAADAQLTGIRASWTATSVEQIGNPTDWSFRFYAPSLNRLYLVGVSRDGQANAAPHFQKERTPPSTIDIETWVVDSPDAIARWLDNGGAAFLREHPNTEVSLQLGQAAGAGQPASPGGHADWTISGFDNASGQFLTLTVDATSGQVAVWQPQ